MARVRRSSLIKRYAMPMTSRKVVVGVVDADNPFSNASTAIEFTRGEAQEVTLQSLSPWEISNLPEGNSNKSLLTVFTNTPLFASTENTDQLSDAIYINNVWFTLNGIESVGQGGWYACVKTSIRNSGVINHCEAVIAKDFNLLDGDNIPQYPSTAQIDTLITTREDLLDSDVWLSTWISENT